MLVRSRASLSASLQHAQGEAGKSIGFFEAIERWAKQADAVALSLAFSLCLGAAAYFLVDREPPSSVVLATVGAAISLAWAGRRLGAPFALQWLSAVLAALALGVAVAKVRTDMVAAPVLTDPVGPILVEGWVSEVEPGRNGPRLRIKTHAIAGLADTERPKIIRLTHSNSLNVGPGRFVRCWAVLRPPPGPSAPGDYDFRRAAWFEQLGAVGYVRGRCRGGALGPPKDVLDALRSDVSVLRRQIAHHVAEAAGARAGGFAAALASGDRSFMALRDAEALRGSGLAHLLAISGLHMAIVGGLAYWILRRGLALIEPLSLRLPVQKAAAIAALLVSAVYLIVSGASVSTQRAFIMAAVFFGAIIMDRPAFSFRSFGIAMALVVVLQPEGVMGAGFQMSFAATGALIALYEAWNRRRRFEPKGWLSGPVFAVQSLVATSVVASAATAPFALYHFERVAPWGLLANLFAMPVVSFLSAPAAAAALILAPFGLDDIGLRLFGLSLEAVLAIAHAFATDGSGRPLFLPNLSFAVSIAAIAAAILFRGRLRMTALVLLPLLAGWLWTTSPKSELIWARSGDVFILEQKGVQRITFVDGDSLSPFDLIDAPITDSCGEGRCLIETSFGDVRLDRTEAGSILSISSTKADREAITLSWSEILRSGGAEIVFDQHKGPSMRHVGECGARPWYPCPQDQS